MTDFVLNALQGLAADGKLDLKVVYTTSAPIEPLVPQAIIDAFEERYRKQFDLTRFDHENEWSNTVRYKHDNIQVLWEGWRDCFVMLSEAAKHGDTDRFRYPSARGT